MIHCKKYDAHVSESCCVARQRSNGSYTYIRPELGTGADFYLCRDCEQGKKVLRRFAGSVTTKKKPQVRRNGKSAKQGRKGSSVWTTHYDERKR